MTITKLVQVFHLKPATNDLQLKFLVAVQNIHH